MTETRDQWIEREARKALVEYNWGSDFWDEHSFEYQERWRRVVAPYYPEPVADAVTLEKLAEVGERAYNADKSNLVDEKWISATKAILRAVKPEPLRVPVDVDGLARAIHDAYYHAGKGWLGAADAALTYLNIEPCPVPEYNPDDVAFRDALKKSQEIVNNWTPDQRSHNSIGYAGLQDNDRNELANLREEVKRLRHKYEVERDRANDLVFDRNFAEAECARLRHQLDIKREAMESMLAEISKLDAAAAVRDAILTAIHQPRDWTDEDVEELAKVLFEAPDAGNVDFYWGDASEYWRETRKSEARAALAWLDGKRGE